MSQLFIFAWSSWGRGLLSVQSLPTAHLLGRRSTCAAFTVYFLIPRQLMHMDNSSAQRYLLSVLTSSFDTVESLEHLSTGSLWVMEISIIFLTHELLFCTKAGDCSDVAQLLGHVFLSKFYKVEDHIFKIFMLNLLILLFVLYIFYRYEDFKPRNHTNNQLYGILILFLHFMCP